MREAAVVVPCPKLLPELLRKLFTPTFGERHVVPTVFGRQIERVAIVGGDDHSDAIDDVILVDVLLIDPQRVGWGREYVFHVVVEPIEIDRALSTLFAYVTRFA